MRHYLVVANQTLGGEALCGPYRVPDDMVRVWAEEMGRNNAWVAGIGGDPQEHQQADHEHDRAARHPPGGALGQAGGRWMVEGYGHKGRIARVRGKG